MVASALTPNQQRFIQEYVANGFNGARAYRMVYRNATPETARANASRMLATASAKELLEHERKRFRREITPTYKKLLNEFAKLAFSAAIFAFVNSATTRSRTESLVLISR